MRCPASFAVLLTLSRSPMMMRLLLWVPLLAANSLENAEQRREYDPFEQSPGMVIDPVLEPGITQRAGGEEVIEDDRTAVRHDEACPDQQQSLLPVCDVAIVFADQPRALRDQQKSPASRVVDPRSPAPPPGRAGPN